MNTEPRTLNPEPSTSYAQTRLAYPSSSAVRLPVQLLTGPQAPSPRAHRLVHRVRSDPRFDAAHPRSVLRIPLELQPRERGQAVYYQPGQRRVSSFVHLAAWRRRAQHARPTSRRAVEFQHRVELPDRPALAGDDVHRHFRRLLDSRLRHRVHAPRQGLLSFLCLSESVHVHDAAAGDGLELHDHVYRMGRSRALLILTHRL